MNDRLPTQPTDHATLRARAREQIEQGAVTKTYGADVEEVVRKLNEALATELVCTLRYRRHYYMAKGVHSESVRNEFIEHAEEELAHADRIAERIVQLGGEPNFSPDGMSQRAHAQYIEGKDLMEMVKEDLIAERIAIDSYREFALWLGDRDTTTRRMIEEILAIEEEHAEDLSSLLEK